MINAVFQAESDQQVNALHLKVRCICPPEYPNLPTLENEERRSRSAESSRPFSQGEHSDRTPPQSVVATTGAAWTHISGEGARTSLKPALNMATPVWGGNSDLGRTRLGLGKHEDGPEYWAWR